MRAIFAAVRRALRALGGFFDAAHDAWTWIRPRAAACAGSVLAGAAAAGEVAFSVPGRVLSAVAGVPGAVLRALGSGGGEIQAAAAAESAARAEQAAAAERSEAREIAAAFRLAAGALSRGALPEDADLERLPDPMRSYLMSLSAEQLSAVARTPLARLARVLARLPSPAAEEEDADSRDTPRSRFAARLPSPGGGPAFAD